jgi:hypothetical protein
MKSLGEPAVCARQSFVLVIQPAQTSVNKLIGPGDRAPEKAAQKQRFA